LDPESAFDMSRVDTPACLAAAAGRDLDRVFVPGSESGLPDDARGNEQNMALVRFWLPAAIGIAGVILVVVGDGAGRGAGIVLIGAALLVVLANVLMRIGLQSEQDREREQANRRYFSRHGRWPDDGI
jgi:hypothetical protein